MSSTKEELESKACVEKRERLFRKLQKTYDMVKELPKNDDVFIARVSQADNELTLFNEIQDKLARLNLVIPVSEQVTIDAPSDSYEDMYYIAVAKCKEIVASKEKVPSNLHQSVAQEVKSLRPKLPPIEIPKFKGDLEKFPAFKSLYDTLVHNTELTAIQKFSFLKSYVEYPASGVIENFDFTDENYQAAYDTLVERYTDKRLVGTHFLNKLFQFKPLANASPYSLRQFLDIFCIQFESLKALKIDDLSDFIVFNLAMKVLDSETKRLFEDKHCKTAFPSFNDLMSFVKDQYKVASMVQAPNTNKQSTSFSKPQLNQKGNSNKSSSHTKTFLVNSQDQRQKCPMCKQDHKLYYCEQFTSMTPTKRLEIAKSLKLCFACLGSHDRSSCKSKYTCRVCKKNNHHTLLHRDQTEAKTEASEFQESHFKVEGPTEKSSTNVMSCNTHPPAFDCASTSGLLGTVKCRIQSQSGDWVQARMIVDPASESSFITESLVQALKLSRRKYSVDIVGVGSSVFPNNRGCVSCKISPRHTLNPILPVEAIVLQTISSNMPKVPLDPSVRKRFSSLQLADPDFDQPGRIDLLLGVQHYSEILSESLVHIKGDPAALDTIFGFIIFGKISANQPPKSSVSMLTHTPPLDDILRRFWEAEEPPQVISKDIDPECERYFSETTTRDNLGRYQVSLPFKEIVAPNHLGSTRKVAQKRLLSLERRLSHNPQFKEEYHANLQDYLDQDHMRPATSKSDYLLTHHAVVKDSTTTKVRVVFNGSEKSTTNTSLNEYLSPGSKLQSDISVIVSSFRLQPIALTADIKQMYRCIRLNPSDTKFTHLLWRSDSCQPIQEYELTTLPFGLTASPYLAQKTIQQLVHDEGKPYPLASQVLQSSIYIDDIVCSVSTENEAICLYNELTSLLQKGRFNLHKISSNSQIVLSQVPKDIQETSVSFESSDCIKLLGFLWDPSRDTFFYKLSLENPVTTKRGILSQVARIYDINGYLSPITFWIKHFIQKLWLAGIGWDEDLPETLKQNWLSFYSHLYEITKIKIPRYINSEFSSVITIIGFCDASEKGYASSVYLRTQSQENVQVHLLKAKSKVAPLKTVTIPKLELNGAVLLAKLIHSLKDVLSHLPQYELYCFTDSATVLAWLHKPPHLLKTYVSNRVVQVLDVIPPSSWRHVSGKQNPSDLASRGLYPNQLSENDLWWHGPSFLCKPFSEWPNNEVLLKDPLPECKSQSVSLIASPKQCEPIESFIESFLNSHSSLTRAQRVLGYVLRFVSNLKKRSSDRTVGNLSLLEMSESMKVMILLTQRQYYSDEMKCVKNNLRIRSSIQHLTPFIQKDGLFMVGGRLALAPISSASKNPCLIPRKSKLAQLICSHYHVITLHGGPHLMQSLIQRKFWIPGIRYLLRSIVFKCLNCYRFKAKPLEPFMSNVPSFRFNKIRAFVNIGVDLAGYFLLKESKRRNAKTQKCWVVLFVCLSTRAVYIDLVSDISTASFLSALDRFISRRGVPSRICSDLGTNFVGAARELKEVYSALIQNNPQLVNYCEERKIIWTFNPPSAPSFGGSWESAVKSMKHHLKRVIGERPLVYEEFSTLLARIEAVLNSRPLCPLSSSPSDGFDYLTPGHFLVGAPLILSRPEEDDSDQPINFNSRWQLITRCVQDFWKRWSREYIHTLMQRPKWNKRTPNLSTGTLVLVEEKNLPPTSWIVGRVVNVFPGDDGIVRVVKIKTASGEYIRPVNKLCVLPFQE